MCSPARNGPHSETVICSSLREFIAAMGKFIDRKEDHMRHSTHHLVGSTTLVLTLAAPCLAFAETGDVVRSNSDQPKQS
jgi:hypothetical protein